MCFGQTTTGTSTQNVTPPGWLSGAAQSNLGFAQGVAGQPYVGQQVAGFTPAQLQAFNQIGNLSSAPDANNPYLTQIAGRYSDVGSAPAFSIAAPSVLGSSIDPRTASLNQYIDPNLQLELNP